MPEHDPFLTALGYGGGIPLPFRRQVKVEVDKPSTKLYTPDLNLPDPTSPTEETVASGMTQAAEIKESLRAIEEFGPLSEEELKLMGVYEPSATSGIYSGVLQRFGITSDMDFDTASKKFWDYVESGKDLTKADAAGFRKWAVHKRRATSGEESPWWGTGKTIHDKLKGRTGSEAFSRWLPSGPGMLTRTRPTQANKEAEARELLMGWMVGGWDPDAAVLGMPSMIGTSRAFDWGRDPEEIRKMLRDMTPPTPPRNRPHWSRVPRGLY